MSDYEKRIQPKFDPGDIYRNLMDDLNSDTQRGTRHNQGKLRYSLLPIHSIEEVVKVLEMGAKKYGDFNWRKGLPYSETLNSLERHLIAFKKSQDKDLESGHFHMAHVIVNALFLLQFQLEDRVDLDDRKEVYK